jgi:hypothetical protein
LSQSRKLVKLIFNGLQQNPARSKTLTPGHFRLLRIHARNSARGVDQRQSTRDSFYFLGPEQYPYAGRIIYRAGTSSHKLALSVKLPVKMVSGHEKFWLVRANFVAFTQRFAKFPVSEMANQSEPCLWSQL